MNKPLFRKEESPDFKDPEAQQAYVKETKNSKELFQKEIDVNMSEQILLEKRIHITKELINDLPASDPQYSMLLLQMKSDLVELDELKIRAQTLADNLLKTNDK